MRPIDQLDQAVEDLAAFMAGFPPDRLEPSTRAEWGAREVFSHLVFWHVEYARLTACLVRGERPPLRTGSFKELNARAVDQYRSASPEVMIADLRTAQAALREVYDQAQGAQIAFRQGSMSRPYPVAIQLIARHIRSHMERLKKGRR